MFIGSERWLQAQLEFGLLDAKLDLSTTLAKASGLENCFDAVLS